MDDEYEEWRPVVGHEKYLVSSLGRVKNVNTNRILKPIMNRRGYLIVSLGYANGRRIHRLVASAFIPNPEHKPEVNHIDGNKTNNRVSNLEWVTRQENQIHATMTGIKPVTGCCSAPRSVIAYHTVSGEQLYFRSTAECSRTLGINNGELSRILHGIERSWYGWWFWFADCFN